MPSTYTSNLGIELPADGELDGVWGDVVNDNMSILDRAINGSITLSLSGTASTLTTSDGVLSDGQYKLLVLGGTPSGTHTITIAPNDAQKIYFVRNTTAQSVVFTQGSGGNVTIATGDSGIIYSNGGGAGAAVVNLTNDFAMSSVKITGGSITGITDLAIADGGTGASDAATARTNLGLAIGTNVQAYDADLAAIAALAVTDGNFIVGNGTTWVAENGATARTSLGLGTIATQNSASVAITGGSITGITDLAVADGGTGASDAATARTNLGLAIGSNVQAYDAGLQSISGLVTSANQMIYTTASDTYTTASLTAAGRALLDDADAAAQRTTLGLGTIATQAANSVSITGGSITGITDLAVADGGTGASDAATARTNLGLAIGTNVQAYDADLAAIAALAVTDGNFIVGNGTTWVAENGATARTSLGLGTIATQNSASVLITGGSITGITDLAVADGGTGASDAATARTNLGLVIGTNVQAYDAGLQSIAGLTTAADRMIYTTASDVYAVTTLTAAGRAILDDADAAAQRTTLGAQATITGAATTITSSNLTASRALTSDGSGKVAVSSVTSTELGYLSGITGITPRTSSTGSAIIATGTTAQRDGSPAAGYFRFNSTLGKFEGYTGSAWGSVGGGATGGGSDEVFFENGQTVTTNYTITNGKNAMSAGPITINSGVTVTVGTGEVWTIV